ncbi:MAG TPA: tetratricopeptide repeat protein [Phycisphaerae bacterium]|nr:tetratricopeptide repeat protein [Phycisphaerae bacterium]
MDLGSHAMAADAFRKAIALQPTYPEALNNLAHALKEMEELDAAVEYCRQAIEIAPRSARIWNNLGSIHKRRGEMDQAINAYREALRTEPSLSQAHSNLILCMQYHPGFDAPTIARELRAWNLQHAARFETQIIPHTNSRLPERTLKVGYVSPDFRDHVVGRNLLPLFKLHDRHDFEVYCYADSPSADGITAAFRRLSHKFRNTSALPDEAVASQIREDQIDILVDLALHTSPRLPLFARKPAPVQVAFAGYPGSTGLTTMDYRITDPYLDPPEQDSNLYAEEAIRLPHSFWCYDPMDAEDIPVGLVPALQNKHVTFGCLNSIFKINATTVERWCRVLRQVDGSKMVLMVPEGSARDWMRRQMASFGIDGQRIEFVPRQSRLAYLELFREIDISLDTFPYNGHTTSLDSLWMGVPLVTIIGNSSLGRAGWSVLSNLGLQELAGTTSDSFTQIAASLAADLPRLAHLRANLREMMRRSPLTNGGGFTEAIQTAYRVMWRRWCNAGVSRPTSD